MLAVLEKSLHPYSPCDFNAAECNTTAVPPARAKAVIPAREDFVPVAPVRLPDVRRLEEPRALSEARSSVAGALAELRQAERALERHLSGLRDYMNRTTAAA
jgi:hypothetical protein